jgi:hypothetical protein
MHIAVNSSDKGNRSLFLIDHLRAGLKHGLGSMRACTRPEGIIRGSHSSLSRAYAPPFAAWAPIGRIAGTAAAWLAEGGLAAGEEVDWDNRIVERGNILLD